MALPTTPFFPLELDPVYGAKETPVLPVISSELTSQIVQRRSRGTTQKRIWDLRFRKTPENLLTLQRHWDIVNAGRDAFPFISPVGRYWYDLASLDGTSRAWGMPLGSSAAITTTVNGYTYNGGQDDGTIAISSAATHNRLPDNIARASDASLWFENDGATVTDDTRRVWNGQSSLFLEIDGTSDYIQPINGSRASITALQSYTYSFYATGSGTLEWQPVVWNSGGTFVALLGTPQTVVLNNTWQRVQVSWTGAATGVQGGFRIGDTGGAGTACQCWLDGFQIERGSAARGWGRPGPNGTWGMNVVYTSAAATNVWISGNGGRVHAARYVGARMPVVAEGVGYSSINVQLEEDLGAY